MTVFEVGGAPVRDGGEGRGAAADEPVAEALVKVGGSNERVLGEFGAVQAAGLEATSRGEVTPATTISRLSPSRLSAPVDDEPSTDGRSDAYLSVGPRAHERQGAIEWTTDPKGEPVRSQTSRRVVAQTAVTWSKGLGAAQAFDDPMGRRRPMPAPGPLTMLK